MFEKYLAFLLEEHEYEDVLLLLTRHVPWRARRALLDRAMVRAGTGPPLAPALRRWIEEETVTGVLKLDWRFVTSADPSWPAPADELYRRTWAETVVVGYRVPRALPELRVVEQTAVHDGTATRALNPALAPLLRMELNDEVRAQLALRDLLQTGARAA